jgi:hypothetical protein
MDCERSSSRAVRQVSDDALESAAARPPQRSLSIPPLTAQMEAPQPPREILRSPPAHADLVLGSLTRRRLAASGKGTLPRKRRGSARPVGHRGTFLILGPVFGVYTWGHFGGLRRKFLGCTDFPQFCCDLSEHCSRWSATVTRTRATVRLIAQTTTITSDMATVKHEAGL